MSFAPEKARPESDGKIAINGMTRLAGVLGWPVSHSRSPRLHNFWIARHGVNGAYLPLPVAPERFADAIRALGHLGFAGANVTVPHKVAALAACDEVSPAARRIGAVNTLVFRENGTLFGTNTDAEGFLANLKDGATGFDPAAAPATVLGAGGAARAIVVALIDAGVPEIRLTNRNPDRAAALAADMSADMGAVCHVVPWADRSLALDGAGLLVNTTSLGMSGQPPLDISLDRLAAGAVVNDIVYDPLRTPLLADAAARGLTAVDGLGMLLHQARVGFQAWFGVEPTVDDALRRHVAKDLMERKE